MTKAKTNRTRKIRRREKLRLKFGSAAVPTHRRKGGRTGASMRKDGKSV